MKMHLYKSAILKVGLSVIVVIVLFALPMRAQKVDSYLSDMNEALIPYGTLTGNSCHAVQIDLNGPWGDFAIPTGQVNNETHELQWMVLQFDIKRIFMDLANLDEDKLNNQAIFSVEYLRKHTKGSPYNADSPMVMFSTKGLNTYMTVHVIDLDKVHAMQGKSGTESDMGLSLDQMKGVFILFQDQAHADAFYKAIAKAIVLCKAQ